MRVEGERADRELTRQAAHPRIATRSDAARERAERGARSDGDERRVGRNACKSRGRDESLEPADRVDRERSADSDPGMRVSDGVEIAAAGREHFYPYFCRPHVDFGGAAIERARERIEVERRA